MISAAHMLGNAYATLRENFEKMCNLICVLVNILIRFCIKIFFKVLSLYRTIYYNYVDGLLRHFPYE